MKTVKLFNLPQEAKGQHKINKVRILRSSEGFDYAIILLDGDIVIKLLPEEDGFSEDAGLILLSEGKYLNFQKKEVPVWDEDEGEDIVIPMDDQDRTISEDTDITVDDLMDV